MRPIHSTAGPLAEALASLPAWAEARDRLAALERYSQPPVESADVAITARIEAALDGDARVDLVDEVAALKIRADAEQLIITTLGRMRQAAAAAMDAAVESGADEILKHLSGQLSDLLDVAAETTSRLGGIDDAESAADSGLLEPYRQMRSLRGEYVALRDAQQRVFAETESLGRRMRDIPVAYIAEPLTADPEFLERRLGQQIRQEKPNGWVLRDPHPAPWPGLHTGEALDWFIRHPDARPWVPTAAQLEDAEEALRAAARKFVEQHRAQVTRKKAI